MMLGLSLIKTKAGKPMRVFPEMDIGFRQNTRLEELYRGNSVILNLKCPVLSPKNQENYLLNL